MNGVRYTEGDIIVISPNEPTDFRVLKDTITTVVKSSRAFRKISGC
jgi:hypothetical protein